MELFLPSLIILIIAGFLVFFIIPRVSPFIIFLLCLVFFFITIQSHFYMFKDEYKLNTWRDQLGVLAKPILISIIIIGVLFALSQFVLGVDISSILNKIKENLSTYSKYTNIPSSKLSELEKQI